MSSEPEPLLSVIVCTHGRPAELERCLRALAALDDEVDVVVVDSASQPPCEGLVQSFAGELRSLAYTYEPVAGLSRARNRGVRATRSEIVAFVDDDAAPRRDWARTIVRPFADPSVACVGGSCLPAFTCEQPPWLSSRLLQFAGITRFGSAAREARSSVEYPFGANVAFRRDEILAAGGFTERLGRVGTSLLSGEEHELIGELRRRHRRIWLEPSAVVDHEVAADRCRPGYYWRRLWWQGVSRARSRRSGRVALTLVIAAPVRALLWLVTRERLYLYRTAETAGYFVECLWPRRPHAS